MDASTDLWTFFVYVVLPYVTIVVFLGGLTYRILRWFKLPRAKAILYPTKSKLGVVSDVTADIFLFRTTFTGSKSLWAMAFLFHAGLALVLIGHLRTVTDVPWLWSLFGLDEAGVERVSFILGTAAGLFMLIGGIMLFFRRFVSKWRVLSLFEDYVGLGLILAVVITGSYMRLFMPLHLDEIHQYTHSVLTFQPAVTVHNPAFLWHFFLAQVTIMYFPVSKLIHGISKPITDSWTGR